MMVDDNMVDGFLWVTWLVAVVFSVLVWIGLIMLGVKVYQYMTAIAPPTGLVVIETKAD